MLWSMFIATKMTYWVDSCIMCLLFICETSDHLTLAQSLLTVDGTWTHHPCCTRPLNRQTILSHVAHEASIEKIPRPTQSATAVMIAHVIFPHQVGDPMGLVTIMGSVTIVDNLLSGRGSHGSCNYHGFCHNRQIEDLMCCFNYHGFCYYCG